MHGGKIKRKNVDALYQTSSLDKDLSLYAWFALFDSESEVFINFLPKYRGVLIRPVFDKKKY